MFHGQQIRSVLLNPRLVVGFLLLVDVVDYRGLVFVQADVDYAVAVVDKDVVVVAFYLNAAAAVDKDVDVVYNVDVVDYDAVLDDYEVGFVVVVVVVVVVADAIGAAS